MVLSTVSPVMRSSCQIDCLLPPTVTCSPYMHADFICGVVDGWMDGPGDEEARRSSIMCHAIGWVSDDDMCLVGCRVENVHACGVV